MKSSFLIALCGVFFAATVSAQQPAAPPSPPIPQQPPSGIPAKPDYGQWWVMNARAVTPHPPGWLFHLEGIGSFANQTGSVSGYQYQANALSALRKGIVTNQLGTALTIQEARVEDNQGDFKQTTARVFDVVFINITKPLNLATAMIAEKDEPKRVHSRFSIFEGLSRSLSLKKGRILSIAGAIGYEAEHVQGQFGPETEQSPTLYAQSFFSSPIANRGVFTQHLEAFYDLVYRSDFRVNWDAGLQMQVNSHISIGPSAQIRYDNHPVSQIQKTDTMVVFGVQFK